MTDGRSRAYSTFFGILFIALLLLFVYSVAEILLLFFVAIIFAIYLAWITEIFQRRLGAPRWLGLMAALLITTLGVTSIAMLMIPPLVTQTQELITALPNQLQQAEVQLMALADRSPMVKQILPKLEVGESYTGLIMNEVAKQIQGFVPYVWSGAGFVIHFISVLVMGVYLALRPATYKEGFIQLAPPVHRELIRDILGDLGRTLRAWIIGQLLAMISLGLFTWIGLVLLDVPYSLAFGVFTGAVAIVPFFGTLVSTLLPAIFVLGAGGFMKFVLVALLGVVVHLLEANLVAPMIMERQVHLPPVLSILSVLIMAHLLHLIGLLVAVPVLCTVIVIVRRVYVHRILEGKGFRRAIRDKPIEIKLPEEGMVLVHPIALETSVPALLEN
ncbi:MAG: AI-2E family transporter [Gemmatimonadota bacterium]